MTSAVRPRNPLRWVFQILIAPATLLERTRGVLRLAVLMVYGMIFGIVGLFAWRAGQLAGLPDVGDPFDVAAFEAVKPQATFSVAQLLQIARSEHKSIEDMNAFYAFRWSGDLLASPLARTYLEANRRTLQYLRQVAALEAEYPQDDTGRDLALSLVDPTSDLVLLCVLEARWHEQEGDLTAAWDWYRVALRVARHIGNQDPVNSRVVVEANVMPEAIMAIDRWAARPDVSATLLRRALDDVKAIGSEFDIDEAFLKSNYLETLHTLDDPPQGLLRKAEADLMQGVDQTAWYKQGELGRRFRWFAKNEPKRSRRVLRLIFANWLARQGDPNRVMTTYTASAPDAQGVFVALDDAPEAPASARILPPQQLADWLASTALLKRMLPDIAQYQSGLSRRADNQEPLLLTLAEQLYLREHGIPPRHAKDLVPGYLDHVPDWFGVEPDTTSEAAQ